MHPNSLAAYRSEVRRISLRAATVYAWIREHGRSTDREVMKGLGYHDPNKVRPRITELVDAGMLAEVDEKIDPETRKRVRVVEVVRSNKQEQLFEATA